MREEKGQRKSAQPLSVVFRGSIQPAEREMRKKGKRVSKPSTTAKRF